MAVEAARLRDTAPDDGRRGWACMCLGWFADNLRGDRVEAPRHYAEALAAGRAVADPLLVFEAQRHLGDHAHDDGDHAEARAAWQESAAAAARGGHVLGVLAQHVLLAVLARDTGDEAGARALAARDAAMGRAARRDPAGRPGRRLPGRGGPHGSAAGGRRQSVRPPSRILGRLGYGMTVVRATDYRGCMRQDLLVRMRRAG